MNVFGSECLRVSDCKHRAEPVMRQGGRDSTAINANNPLLNKVERPTPKPLLPEKIRCPHHFNRPPRQQLSLHKLTFVNIWLLTKYPGCIFSRFPPRHIPACEGDPDLRFHLLRSSHPQRPMGGILFLSARICRSVLWAVLRRIHAARSQQRPTFAVCAVQLPPAWNLSPGDR